MTLIDGQHCTWFVASLTTHLRIDLSKHKISTQAEVLETTMRLHATPILDPGWEFSKSMCNFKTLSLEVQRLKQGRVSLLEVHLEVGYIKCKSQVHDKDHCPVFVKYLVGGSLMPLKVEVQDGPSAAPVLWCMIFQEGGKHATDNYHLLQKYTQTSQQLNCNFYRSVGHNEKMCQSSDLMLERTLAYRVQIEVWGGFQGCGWEKD